MKLVKMDEWFKWFPGDKRGSMNNATYSALQTALVESGHGDIARDLISYDNLALKHI